MIIRVTDKYRLHRISFEIIELTCDKCKRVVKKLDKVLFSGFFDRFIETEIKLTIVLHVP